MKILFIGTTGVHHALIAAHIFLGRLTKPDFRLVEAFCDNAKDASGYPILIYDDVKGNQVYTLGVGKDVALGKKAIEQMVDLLGYTSQDLLVKPVSIKGEKLLLLLSKIPDFLGGTQLNMFVGDRLLKREFSSIVEDINRLKVQINVELVNQPPLA